MKILQTFEPMDEKTSRLLELLEAGCDQYGTRNAAALDAMPVELKMEAAATLMQNIDAIRKAGRGVAAVQRAMVYAALLRMTLAEWRKHGSESGDE